MTLLLTNDKLFQQGEAKKTFPLFCARPQNLFLLQKFNNGFLCPKGLLICTMMISSRSIFVIIYKDAIF